MKVQKIKIALVLLVFGLQGLTAQSLFDKYARQEEVTSVVISESMFKLFANMQLVINDPDAQAFVDLAKEISSLRVLTTSDSTTAEALKEDAFSYVNSKRLMELMIVKDDESQVYFYADSGKGDRIKELLMLVTELKNVNLNGRNFETVLLSITGDLEMEKIGLLASKMNLPEELGELNRNQD